MGNTSASARASTRQAPYSPLDRINIEVTQQRSSSSKRRIGYLRSANTLHVKSDQLAGAPAMVMLCIAVMNNGPSIFAKAYNGYQLHSAFTASTGTLKIWCTALNSPYDLSDAPSTLTHIYGPDIREIIIIEVSNIIIEFSN